MTEKQPLLPENFKRMRFKNNKVWAAITPDGNIDINDSKVLIKYDLAQDYQYLVHKDSLRSLEEPAPGESTPVKKPKKSRKAAAGKETSVGEDCIRVYTDGASSGNPGPSGIGVLLIYKDHKKEISESIGHATNNIAELTAILAALKELKRHDLPVRIFSDSTYSIGLLTQNWKPQKNRELVAEIKRRMKPFKDLEFIKVKGHAGIRENEVADFLATSAIKNESKG